MVVSYLMKETKRRDLLLIQEIENFLRHYDSHMRPGIRDQNCLLCQYPLKPLEDETSKENLIPFQSLI